MTPHSLTLLLAADDGTGAPRGLSFTAHLFLLSGTLAAIVFLMSLLRKRQLRGKHAMLWTALGIALFFLALVPSALTWVSDRLGIDYAPALFLVVAIGSLLLVVIQFSWELSRMEDRTRILAEEIALLRAELELTERELGPGPGGGPGRVDADR